VHPFSHVVFVDEESAKIIVLRDKSYGGMYFALKLTDVYDLLVLGPLTDNYMLVLASVVKRETVDQLRREGALVARVERLEPPEVLEKLVKAGLMVLKRRG